MATPVHPSSSQGATDYSMNGPTSATNSVVSAATTSRATTAQAATAHPAGLAYATPARKSRRVPVPRVWPLKDYDVYALLGGNAFVILAMWIRHGNLHELGTPAGIVTAAGEIAALYGTYLVLIQLVLMSRSPWLDHVFGQDRIIAAHRWVGFSAIWLLFAHFILTTVGYAMADGQSPIGEALNLLATYPYVLWSGVALVLFVVVGISSVRAVRERASYETWYMIHLYTYLAIALGFMHQLAVGIDFTTDPIARIYWIALYVLAAGTLLVFRFGQPSAVSRRHRLHVANVVQEGPGVVSIYLTGNELDRLPVRAGQWFRLRFLTSTGWWRAHPFSISAAPNGRYLRFTIKDLGDYTRLLQRVRVGTGVFVEGPYGVFTGARRTKPKVLLVAGGIGITPLRALLEELPAARGNMTLIYRASHEDDVVFRRELDELASLRGATVHYLVGRRGSPEMPSDPLDPKVLRRLVPDVQERDIYVCGPAGMMERVLSGLHRLRIPESQIHYERFAF
jgi:predicted ferric reductase